MCGQRRNDFKFHYNYIEIELRIFEQTYVYFPMKFSVVRFCQYTGVTSYTANVIFRQ